MKKLLSLVCTVLIVSGCGGDSTDNQSVQSALNKDAVVSIDVPKEWLIWEKEDTNLVWQDNKLSSDVVFASADITRTLNNFTPNINIISAPLNQNMSALQFAIANINGTKSESKLYEEISIDNVKIDGQETKIHTFVASVDGSEENKALFVMSFLIKGNDSYTITGTLHKDDTNDVIDQYKNIIKNVKLK